MGWTQASVCGIVSMVLPCSQERCWSLVQMWAVGASVEGSVDVRHSVAFEVHVTFCAGEAQIVELREAQTRHEEPRNS